MTLPFTLPDWAPPWAGFVIVSVAVLFLLAFLLMPFSVFGLKGRLDVIEERLDDIQADIRALALRVPDSRRVDYEPEPVVAPLRRPVPRDASRDDAQEAWTGAARPLPRAAPPDPPPPPPNRRVGPPRTLRPDTRTEPRLDPN
jgi:hypothetical protein